MPTSTREFMIYGANGYTGELCARGAVARGMRPILCGRNERAVRELAEELEVEARIFSLADPAVVADGLDGVGLVLHCAGPFSSTAEPMVHAAADRGVHYLDVTGEIDVFEYIHQRSDVWKQAGIIALPGVGMDVVPTDCLANKLKAALPTADTLELAFRWLNRPSAGTMRSSVEGAAGGPRWRRDGVIGAAPASTRRRVPFADGEAACSAIPWGDVSTAYHSTGIPNITVYATLPPVPKVVQKIIGLGAIQRAAKAVLTSGSGPSEAQRAKGRSEFWGRVTSPDGRWASMTVTGPDTYDLTVITSLATVTRILEAPPAPGAHTPSTALGADFIDQFEQIVQGPLQTGSPS